MPSALGLLVPPALALWSSTQNTATVELVTDPLFEGRASAPACVLTEDGAFLVAWESRDDGERDVLVRRRDPADGWSAPSLRLDTDAPGAARSLEIRLAVGEPGHVHCAWQDSRHGKDDVFLNRSTDGGRTWLAEDVRVGTTSPGSSTSSMIALAADREGRAYLAWEDRRDGDRDVYFTRSTDAGVTWEAERRLDSDPPGAAISYHPQLACWDDGTVVAIWWDERSGLADLYVRRSTDGGVTWGPPETRLDPGEPGAAASRDAKLAVSGDRIVVAWEDEVENREKDVHVRVSVDRGGSWGPDVVFAERVGYRPGGASPELDVPNRLEDPRPAIDASGRVVVTWTEGVGFKTAYGGEVVNVVDVPELRDHVQRALILGVIDGEETSTHSFRHGDLAGTRASWIGAGDGRFWCANRGPRFLQAFHSDRPGEEWFGSVNRGIDSEHSLAGAVGPDGRALLVWINDTGGRSVLMSALLEPGGE